MRRSDCILVYGSTTKGDVVKRSDCILVYGSTTKGGVVSTVSPVLVTAELPNLSAGHDSYRASDVSTNYYSE